MRRHFRSLSLTFLAGIWLLLVAPALAQTPLPPDRPLPPPMPPEWQFDGLVIEYQRVDVTIENQIATTRIEQKFVNQGQRPLEGTYLFPLPAGASVTELIMWVDGRPFEAKILDAGEARQIYDEIVRQLRDPALLEYVGTGAIQANVFPIPAQDDRTVEIEYRQILEADNGLFRYVYPQATDLYTNQPLVSQRIRVDLRSNEALRTIYSPSHPVSISRDSDFAALIGFEAGQVMADKDFELFYSVSPEAIGLSLISFKEAGEDGFFLLLAAPSVVVEPEAVVAKDIILVLDTSGSMEGQKLAQARRAASYVVEHLNPQDRFNVVAFSTGVRLFAPRPVGAQEAGAAATWIDRLEALGGTNISQALLDAATQVDQERPTTIIFLTDGLATEGIVETGLLLNSVAAATPANARIFAFGVGNDVDTILLDSLAQNHRGTTAYVRPTEAIDEEVTTFYARVSTPVLADISLDFGGILVEQLYPATLPDLFAGSQLVLVGRYRAGGPATITLNGTVNGRQQRFVYEDSFFRRSGGDDFIPRLWATRAIGHLLNEIRLRGEQDELVRSVVNLSVRYGIITPYTSFLITEDDMLRQSARDDFARGQDGTLAPAAPSGEAAVDAADTAGSLAEAEAPLPLATMAPGEGGVAGALGGGQPAVLAVGSKTFVQQGQTWIDTTYDPDHYSLNPVTFAGEAYFALLDAAPEMGQYLALGPHVIVVYQGVAYEIVSEPTESPVPMPVVNDPSGETPAGSGTADPAAGGSTAPGGGTAPGGSTVASGSTPDGQAPLAGVLDSEVSTGLCFVPLALLVVGLLFFGLGAGRRFFGS